MKNYIASIAVALIIAFGLSGCIVPNDQNDADARSVTQQNPNEVTPTLVLKQGITYYSISRIVDCDLKQIIYYTGNGGIALLDANYTNITIKLYEDTCKGVINNVQI